MTRRGYGAGRDQRGDKKAHFQERNI